MKRSLMILMAVICWTHVVTAMAQESHYQRAMRSEKDNEKYGVVGSPNVTSGGLTNGIYWSRHRNVDDVIIREEAPADSIQRRAEFTRPMMPTRAAIVITPSSTATVLYKSITIRQNSISSWLSLSINLVTTRMQNMPTNKPSAQATPMGNWPTKLLKPAKRN